MFLEDETYCSGIDAPLPALSNGSRGSHFLSMSKLMTAGDALLPNLCSVGGSLNGGSRSLFMPISSPVGIICAYCLFACRFAPRFTHVSLFVYLIRSLIDNVL